MVFYSLDDMRQAIEEGEVGVVFGGTSSILTGIKGGPDRAIHALTPKEGLLLWVNCAALIDSKRPNPEGASLIAWWMKNDVQKKLCDYPLYLGCPVERDALLETRNSDSHPAAPTLRKLINEENKVNAKYPIAIRGFPEHTWRAWAHHWEIMLRDISS